jgi:hypothetical protein
MDAMMENHAWPQLSLKSSQHLKETGARGDRATQIYSIFFSLITCREACL